LKQCNVRCLSRRHRNFACEYNLSSFLATVVSGNDFGTLEMRPVKCGLRIVQQYKGYIGLWSE